MKHKIHIHLFALTFFSLYFISCATDTEQNDTSFKDQSQNGFNSQGSENEGIIDTSALVSDTSSAVTPSEPAPKQKLKVSRFKNRLEVMKTYFSRNSRPDEVRMCMGNPEHIEFNGVFEQVWYYDECIIYFKNGAVDNVNSKCPKCKSLWDLLEDEDPEVADFGNYLFNRSNN